MSVSGNGTRLAAISRELMSQWANTKLQWKDAKSAEFERHYLAELMSSVDRAVATIESLDKLITKVRKDCE